MQKDEKLNQFDSELQSIFTEISLGRDDRIKVS
jgi:hypothetical protein